MKKIPNEIYDYISSIQRVEFFQEQIVLYTKEGIYAYIPVCSSKEIFDYLEDIHFQSFYVPINSNHDSFQLFQIEGEPNKKRLFLLEELYTKSSHIISFDSQIIQRIYQKCYQTIRRQYQFYFDVQNRIEEMYYPRRPFYNLLLKMSDIYRLLSLGEFFLNEWMQLQPIEYREVLTLRKLDSPNFWGDQIIDVSSSRRDYYIYELANYYQKYYDEDSILDELDSFFHHFSCSQEDLLLFYVLISFVEEFDFEDFQQEESLVSYVLKTNSFLSEKYKEYQKNKEKMFKEK